MSTRAEHRQGLEVVMGVLSIISSVLLIVGR